MEDKTLNAHNHFIQGMSRIADFWGFPKAMGSAYGAIYLSPNPMTLDEMVNAIGVTKGAVSTNIRYLERLGMVHKKIQIGDRKDYYIAETDFWKIIKGILREREKHEFDQALKTVTESLDMLKVPGKKKKTTDSDELFYVERILEMKKFFDGIDSMVATFLAIDDLKSLKFMDFFGGKKNK